MNRYGQDITWSTTGAPRPFTGIITSYSYEEQMQEYFDEDESGDHRALITSGRKAALEWEAKVTEDSRDFLDLSAGAKIEVSDIISGTVLAYGATERWALNTPKTISVRATHFPDMTDSSGPAAGTDVDAFVPDPSALTNVFPGSKLIYSTTGLTHAVGVVHGLTIEQSLQIAEDDLTPAGTVPGAATHGYQRKITLELLATGERPTVGDKLVIGGEIAGHEDYRITSSGLRFATKKGKMYQVSAVWIPPFTTA